MNPDKPSREQIEARITALLLGELPAEEAELLRWTISQDAELQKLHSRLLLTVGLVRETIAHPTETSAEKSVPRKLSDERRQKLLAHFKTPRPMPKELFWLKRLEIRPLVTALALVAIVAVAAALLLPATARSKRAAMRASLGANASVETLREKEQPVVGLSANLGQPAAAAPLPPPTVAPPPPADIYLPQVQESPAGVPAQSEQLATANPAPANAETEIRVFPLKYGSATDVAKEVGSIFQKPNPQNSQNAQSVNAVADSRIQSVVVTAPKGLMNEVADVMSELDTPSARDQSVATVQLQNGNPQQVAQEFQNMFASSSTSRSGAGSSQNSALQQRAQSTTTSMGTTTTSSGISGVGGSGGGGGGGGGGFGGRRGGGGGFGGGGGSGGGGGGFGSGGNPFAAQFGGGGRGGGRGGGGSVSGANVPVEVVGGGGATSVLNKRVDQFGIAEPTPADTTLAWNGSVADRSRTENQPENGWRGGTLLGPVANGGDVAALQNKAQIVGGETFYRNPTGETSAEKTPAQGFDMFLGNIVNGSVVANGGSEVVAEKEKAPVLGDVPLAGRKFASSATAPTVAPAPSRAPVQTLNGFFDDSFTARNSAEAAKELQKIGSGTLALNGNNSYVAGVVVNNGTLVAGTSIQQRLASINNSAAANGREGQNGIVGQTTVSADSTTHNLVIAADAPTSDRIRGVVASLDVPATTTPGGVAQFEFAATNVITTSKSLPTNLSQNDITLNFQNAPVDGVLNYLSETAGFVIVEDTRVKGNVSIIGSHLTQSEAVDLLNSELNRNGYAAIRSGRTLTIVNKNEAKTSDVPIQKPPQPAPIPQPEILTRENAFSTFSMNVSDVSFKLAAASLEKGQMPAASSIRSEEFINAFDYRDPEAPAGVAVAFTSERARYPFAHNRDLLRFSIKTAASGRAAGRPLNLVLLLDTSGSMERADRVEIIREAMRVLAAQLHPQDIVSVVTFARTARLWADGVPGDKAGETLEKVGGITPEGGTNLEEAMRLAYETARRHYLANGMNRVVLLTDGAANLGNVDPGALKQKVEAQRRQGIALDCFGIGWEDYNDDLLEQLSGNGDGRYAFINSPEEAGTEFAAKLAGALQVAAEDVKVQVEFNPQRVISWRQIGYAKHQLTKEQFRDNSVLAAEIAAQEAGNALYTVEIKPDGSGPIATVYVRYRIPGTQDVRERSWAVDYNGTAPVLEQSSSAMRLAATASAFSEWLAASPFAQEVTPDELLKDLSSVPQIYGADQRPKQLEWMIRQAKSLMGQPGRF